MKHYSTTANSVYNKFYSGLKSLGYPNSLRKIGISNGSLNNIPNESGCKLAVDAYAKLNINVAKICTWPNTGSCDVFKGTFVEIAPWWMWLLGIGYLAGETTRVTKSADPNQCSIDAAPGCKYETFKMVGEALQMAKDAGTIKKYDVFFDSHCFMPTTSVLDISGNMNYCTDISNLNLVNNSTIYKTPFDSYWGPIGKNMDHATLDQDLVDWLANEIETYISPSGKRQLSLCGGDTAHYTVHFPTGKTSTVNWVCSPNLQIVSGQGTKTIIVKPVGMGDAWVEATLTQNGILTHNKTLKKYAINVTFSEPVTIAPTTINNSRSWNSPMLALQDITILSVGELAMSSTLYLAPGVKIIVNPGGKLIVHGGKFTNACPNQMWHGVVVQGDLSKPMTKFYQGFVQMDNNGKIENAECGINVQDCGIVEATNANLINNTTNVKFGAIAATQTGISGTFTNTKFTLDNSYIGNAANFEAHLKMTGSGEVQVNGCTFSSPVSSNINNGINVEDTPLKMLGNNQLLSVPVLINSSAVLTNTGTISSDANATITISPKGKMVVDGGTLTNYTVGIMWKGITVMGDATKPMTKTEQGYIELKNSGKIENAECGIKVKGGGIVEATGAKFLNNKTGIKFEQLLNGQSGRSGTFTQTNFTTNSSYIGDIGNFEAHIATSKSGSIVVYGCDFLSTAPQAPNSPGFNNGITLSNTSLTVKDYCLPGSLISYPDGKCSDSKPSTFTGFFHGIKATNSGSSPTFKISYSTFNENLYGINIDGINNFELIRNTVTSTHNNSFGVFIANATGYKIEENNFYGTTSLKTTTGLRVGSSNVAENEVYKNNFTNLRTGQQFTGINSSLIDTLSPFLDSLTVTQHRGLVTGLQSLCNCFVGGQYRDILVGYENTTTIYTKLSIRQEQGSAQKPAGNWFSPTLPASNPHFENKSQHFIEYYHGTNPKELPRFLGRKNLHLVNFTNTCPSKIGTIISQESALTQYDEWNEEYQYWLNRLLEYEGDTNNEEYIMLLNMVSYFSQLKDNYYNSIIVTAYNDDNELNDDDEENDSTPDDEFIEKRSGNYDYSKFENLRFLYAYRGNYTDNLCIAETYISENKFGEALATIAQMYERFRLTEEQIFELRGLQTYVNWLVQLAENEKSIYLLPENEINYLVNFVETQTGRGVVFANNILCALYNICKEDETMRGLDGEVMKAEEQKSRKGESEKEDSYGLMVLRSYGLENITLVPNPTTGEFTIDNEQLTINSVEVFDIYGRKQNIQFHSYGLTVLRSYGLSNLPAGVYFVKIFTTQGEIVKKIVKE